MSIRTMLVGARELEIDSSESGEIWVNFQVCEDGSLEIVTDAFGEDGVAVKFTVEDAPDVLLAIQTWIESLNATKDAS